MLSVKSLARFSFLVALILSIGIESSTGAEAPLSASGDQASVAVAATTVPTNSNANQNDSNSPIITTAAPIALSPTSEPINFAPETTSSPKVASGLETIKVADHGSASSSTTASPALIVHHNSTTAKPTEPSKLVTHSPHIAPIVSQTNATSANTNHSTKSIHVDQIDEQQNNKTTYRFCDYLKPICNSTDKIQPKQMFRIQTQFKQFVELTNGKLGLCLMENYMFDPVLKPVTKGQLIAICASKKLPTSLKGSYGSFQNCAAKNWEPALDKELDKINEARVNCAKNHNHSKLNATLGPSEGLAHEEDEFSLISQMVNEVLEGGKDGQANKDLGIQVIDMGLSSTNKPNGLHSAANHTDQPTNGSSHSKIDVDPKTVVVLMDENNRTTSAPTSASVGSMEKLPINTTPAPISSFTTTAKSHPVNSTPKPTIADHLQVATNTTLAHSTSKPSNGSVKIELGLHGEANRVTVAPKSHPIEISSTTIVPLASTTGLPSSTVRPLHESLSGMKTTPMPHNSSHKTTKKLESLLKSTKAPIANAKVTAAVAGDPLKHQPSEKPAETLDQVLERQEKEKEEFEQKLRIEREKALKQLERKKQEDKGRQGADNRMHQLEHDRQMSVDPIGHTIKHQQYEANKQQKMLGRK